MSGSSSPTQQDTRTGLPPHQVDPAQLIEREGTVPFVGLTDTSAGYPAAVSPYGPRFVDDDSQTFKQAIQILPQAGEGSLWADNEFVEVQDDDSVAVDTEAIRNIHALSVDQLEQKADAPLEQIVADADPSPLIDVSGHKDIIDRRRLALHTLFEPDVKFRWQIASSTYEPGDMQRFLKRKIVASQKQTDGDAFGWIDHYDWGGSVSITTIYPGMEHSVGLPDGVDMAPDGSLTLVDEPGGVTNSDDSLTIYYGDRLGYDFRGSQTLWAYPVIYVPEEDVMIQLPEPRFKRRHVGDFMDPNSERSSGRVPPVEWHENILEKIDSLSASINGNIIRARLLAIDFSDIPFSVEEFYSYLGIPDEYAEVAANRAKALAASTAYHCPSPACDWSFESKAQLQQHYESIHNSSFETTVDETSDDDSPSRPQPSLWNLQLSLKIALADNFSGARAGDTYQSYQELSGQILQHPQHQLRLAYKEHDRRDDTEDSLFNDEQQSLGDSLGDVIELPGVTEDSLDASQTQQISQQVQEQLDSF